MNLFTAKCHSAECCWAVNVDSHFAECHSDDSHSDECHSVKCHSNECDSIACHSTVIMLNYESFCLALFSLASFFCVFLHYMSFCSNFLV